MAQNPNTHKIILFSGDVDHVNRTCSGDALVVFAMRPDHLIRGLSQISYEDKDNKIKNFDNVSTCCFVDKGSWELFPNDINDSSKHFEQSSNIESVSGISCVLSTPTR